MMLVIFGLGYDSLRTGLWSTPIMDEMGNKRFKLANFK